MTLSETKESLKATFTQLEELINELDKHYQERETGISQQIFELRVIEEKAKKLEEDKKALADERSLIDKEKELLREKQRSLELLNKKLQEKSERIQRIISEGDYG